MPKFPGPPEPAALARVPPTLRVLPAGTRLCRVYFRGGNHPALWYDFRAYGPVATARFDHQPDPPHLDETRAVLYAALAGPTCLAEVFQDRRLIDRHHRAPWLVHCRLAADLSLLDLTGTWPTRAGASMALSSGPRARARAWSRAIYAAYPAVQGLLYPSSMYRHARCVALYERALAAIPETPSLHLPLAAPALEPLLRRVAADIGYGLV
ncbi:MAG TPA: RES domain-containing protein [Thermomicrobiales bacterium]|nr:RES domain-containing protein [Thermomicrobiales bacterium]